VVAEQKYFPACVGNGWFWIFCCKRCLGGSSDPELERSDASAKETSSLMLGVNATTVIGNTVREESFDAEHWVGKELLAVSF